MQALSNLVSSPTSPAYSPAVYACIAETMGRSVPPLVHSGATWVYDRTSSILLRAYHSPDSPVAKMLLYGPSSSFGKPAPAAGEALDPEYALMTTHGNLQFMLVIFYCQVFHAHVK